MRVIDITKTASSNSTFDLIITRDINFLMFDFSDLSLFKKEIPELYQASGIYLLLGDNDLYIGQSQHLGRRLSQHQHNENKNWITRAIMFTNKEYLIGKDMLNYIEHFLIEHFKHTERKLRNSDTGQKTSIFIQNKIKSDNILYAFFDVMDFFQIDLMQTSGDFSLSLKNSFRQKEITFNEEIYPITSKGGLDLYKEVLKKMYKIDPDFVKNRRINTKPSCNFTLGSKPSVMLNGTILSEEFQLDNDIFYIYNDLSDSSFYNIVAKLIDDFEKLSP